MLSEIINARIESKSGGNENMSGGSWKNTSRTGNREIFARKRPTVSGRKIDKSERRGRKLIFHGPSG